MELSRVVKLSGVVELSVMELNGVELFGIYGPNGNSSNNYIF